MLYRSGGRTERASPPGYILDSCDLVLHLHGPQALVDLMQDPLAQEAAAPAVQASHDHAVRADQHRVPVQLVALTHRLATGGAVTGRAHNHTRSEEELGTPSHSYHDML